MLPAAAPSHRNAAASLVVGCVVFGLGSLIVKFVPVGAYAIAFWRLAVAGVIFLAAGAFFRPAPAQTKKPSKWR